MVREKTIHELIDHNSNIAVTITLPTHKVGEDTKQDPIRLKNLLAKAEKQIKNRESKNGYAESLIKPAYDLLNKPMFWAHAESGLAIYISDSKFDVHKLPYSLDEQVYVNDHFLITPLLPMTSIDGTFTVLTASRQNLKLLRCTRESQEDITPGSIPTAVDEYLEIEPEKQLQFHTGSKGQKAMYFGHNSNEEDKMVIVEQFYREAEREITSLLNDLGDPLIVIGLNENSGIYKKVNSYNRLVETVVKQNPDELSDKELREKGWGVIQSYFLSDMYTTLEKMGKTSDEKFSNNLGEIVEATVMGKSSSVFISKGEKKWGFYDEENHTVQYTSNPGGEDVDLLNWLSIKAFKTGSKVYMLPKEEMPMHATVAAEFRF